ncbi:heme A synthase [Amaricoccus sp.]|uniref:heme A synthase n=1 Tax=Amaricoccus sp. TaxID=1872485 RepID=UPI001B44ECE6|nr:heme A synthase [Amaricoccus sp.]MBP7001466.1 COX15/CtaA family protein [Amaricoccus sp.]
MATKKRSIFEEVAAKPSEPVAAPPRRPATSRRAIAAWLSVLFALVVAMIVVGGLTRLTDAGLSITEWKPIAGALPPADDAAWEAEFANYRAIPQFELTRPDMTLAEFKRIYWWEWGHRQLGRLIGLVWAGGFLWFLARRRIPPGWTGRLLGLGALGGLQGAVGWWMVASGLAPEMVAVASHRLAIHLGIAFVILGVIAWWVMTLRREDADLLQARRQRSAPLMRWGSALAAVAFVQVLLGALVAGIDAGRGFPEWPLMGGQLVPPDAFALEPGWRNFLDNPGLVQFNHRMVGYLLLVLGVVAWARSRRSALGDIRGAFDAMAAMLVAQLGLGILTALYAAPWQVAIVHQLGAVALFALILRARFAALYPRAQKIARGPR